MEKKKSLFALARKHLPGIVDFLKHFDLNLEPAYMNGRKVCIQCYVPISTSSASENEFCSQYCEMKCWEEFNSLHRKHSGEVPLCKFPRCFKRCYVENNGHIHDYCNRSHAVEHKKVKEEAERQQRASRRQGGRQARGDGHKTRNDSSHNQAAFYSQQERGGGARYLTSAQNIGPIYFYNRDEPYYEFTNFFMGAPINLDGLQWPTTEHYFQAQKFVGTPYVEKIRTAPWPRDAFDLSRQPSISQWRRSDWENVKMDIMRKALFAKFTAHSYLRDRLVRTGDKTLVERSPYDSFWGDGGNGLGQNHLGKLLMELRAKLQASHEADVQRDSVTALQRKDSTSNGNSPCHHSTPPGEAPLEKKVAHLESNESSTTQVCQHYGPQCTGGEKVGHGVPIRARDPLHAETKTEDQEEDMEIVQDLISFDDDKITASKPASESSGQSAELHNPLDMDTNEQGSGVTPMDAIIN